MMNAKIRGIYSTALTKLLLEGGFAIVQPSPTIKTRFQLQENLELADLNVKDRYDLQGVRVLATSDAISAFRNILHSTFADALTRSWPVSVDGIYRGTIVESDERSVYVDVGGGCVGRLSVFEDVNSEDKHMTVQVERKRMGARQPILTTKLKIVGKYAILAQDSKTGVSLEIQDISKRTELYALGKTLAPEGWGIIWRAHSATQPKETLENEVAVLAKKIEILNKKASVAESSTLLLQGLYFMDVEFPSNSKKAMDRLRASVAQTLDGHHFYKSCGGNVSSALEMAEKLLEKGQEKSKVETAFEEQVAATFPEDGSPVYVEHVKPSGFIFHLGQATVEKLENGQLRYVRTMKADGFYDGLGVKKEAGDKAVSETELGEWWITTKYFSEDGQLKGTYVNLNTPVEIYPKAIRYVDLEVDVSIQPDGTKKVLDMEKLENALEKGIVSKALFEIVKEKRNIIIQDAHNVEEAKK